MRESRRLGPDGFLRRTFALSVEYARAKARKILLAERALAPPCGRWGVAIEIMNGGDAMSPSLSVDGPFYAQDAVAARIFRTWRALRFPEADR